MIFFTDQLNKTSLTGQEENPESREANQELDFYNIENVVEKNKQ